MCESVADACNKLRAMLLRAQQRLPGCEKEAAEPLRSALTMAREHAIRVNSVVSSFTLYANVLRRVKVFFDEHSMNSQLRKKGPENIWPRRSFYALDSGVPVELSSFSHIFMEKIYSFGFYMSTLYSRPHQAAHRPNVALIHVSNNLPDRCQ